MRLTPEEFAKSNLEQDAIVVQYCIDNQKYYIFTNYKVLPYNIGIYNKNNYNKKFWHTNCYSIIHTSIIMLCGILIAIA